jgi:hypothetical protein
LPLVTTGDLAYQMAYTPVPEPGTAVLCALGIRRRSQFS